MPTNDPSHPHRFSKEEIQAVYRAIQERRDMRHFLPTPIDPQLLKRLFTAAHAAPSVGYMQPWRFIRITSPQLRNQIYHLAEEERQATAEALGKRKDEFLELKVEGIMDCGEVIVVALMPNREPHLFGRRTLPEMDLASVSCAIQNMWLAARAEGIGMGWVSFFDPQKLKSLLKMPQGSHPIAVLCLGHVKAFYDEPMLAQENWAQKEELKNLIMENEWNKASDCN